MQQQGFSERLMREKRAVESELLKVSPTVVTCQCIVVILFPLCYLLCVDQVPPSFIW